jgi:integrase
VQGKDGPPIKLTTTSKARYLNDLKAAVRFAMAENKCETVTLYWDIPKHARRKRTTWYTRDQIAKLVWRAHSKRGKYVFSAKKSCEAKAGIVKISKLRPMRHIARMILVAVGTGTRSERVEMASFYDIPGHPFIDVDAGIFWRSWEGEDVSANKRAEPCVLHPALLVQCRRWKAMGLRWLTEYRGRPVKVSSAFYRLVREVLEDEAPGRSIHTMRHTAATWLMSSPKKLNVNVIAGFLCMDVQVLVDVYGHHSPDSRARSKRHGGRATSAATDRASPRQRTRSRSCCWRSAGGDCSTSPRPWTRLRRRSPSSSQRPPRRWTAYAPG